MISDLAKKYKTQIIRHSEYFYYLDIHASERHFISIRMGGFAGSIPTGKVSRKFSEFTHVEIGFVQDGNYFIPQGYEALYPPSEIVLREVPLERATELVAKFLADYQT